MENYIIGSASCEALVFVSSFLLSSFDSSTSISPRSFAFLLALPSIIAFSSALRMMVASSSAISLAASPFGIEYFLRDAAITSSLYEG